MNLEETYFIRDDWFLIIFIWWEKCWRNEQNSIFITTTRKVTKESWKTTEELAHLMYVRKYIATFSMQNCKRKQKSSLWNARMDSEMTKLASIEYLV